MVAPVPGVKEGIPYGVKNSGFAETSGKGGRVSDMLIANIVFILDGVPVPGVTVGVHMEFRTQISMKFV